MIRTDDTPATGASGVEVPAVVEPTAPNGRERSDVEKWVLQGLGFAQRLLTRRGGGGAEPQRARSPRSRRSRPQPSRPQLRLKLSPLTLVLVLGVAGFFLLPGDLLYAGSTSMAAGLIGLGLFLPIAALRELPLNGAGMAGLGAYLFAYYGSHGGAGSHLLGIAIALASVVAISLLGGLASLVVTGLYFVVASLVIQVAIEKVIFSIPVLTGGASGRSVWQPISSGFFSTQRIIYMITAAVVLSCALAVWRLLRSRPGFHAVLVGHVPEGATSTGLRNWVVKLEVFAISGVLIGIAGLLYAFVNGTPPPPFSFGIIYAVIFIAIPIASGMRDLSSIWLVAAAFTCIPIGLEQYQISPNLLSGIILLSALLLGQHRDRIGGVVKRLRARLPGGRPREAAAPEAAPPVAELLGVAAAPAPVSEAASVSSAVHAVAGNGAVGAPAVAVAHSAPPRPSESKPLGTLVGRNIVVDFGGVRAVDGVHGRVEPGHRVGIVGANGAGKTTFFNALSGFVPFQGKVTLGGEDITQWAPYARARAGIRRTFQQPRLADLLTVEQNVICGYGHDAERQDRVDWLVERFGLGPFRGFPVAALPFGVRRQVECIRALSRRPQILLLDEPVSGLEDEEAEMLAEILIELQSVEGWALMVIEHDLRFITAISQYLMVMENGRQITQGLLHDVMQQEEVRRVYLGEAVSV